MADSPLPIETRYAGCRFRSRMEARWAVFFDHMHVKWEYEPEGYKLRSGELYLPDFLLPDLDVSGMALGLFVEVKPDRRENLVWDPPHQLPKCSGLATSDIPVLLAVGSPSDCTGFLFAPETGIGDNDYCGLCLDGWAAGGCLLMPLFNGHVGLLSTPLGPKYCHCRLWQAGSSAGEARDLFDEACTAFKSARFEHGESG
jgi:hypothetical protein